MCLPAMTVIATIFILFGGPSKHHLSLEMTEWVVVLFHWLPAPALASVISIGNL